MTPDDLLVDRSEPGVGVIVLRGEHETYTAPKLEHEASTLFDAGLAVVVDLTAATFVDSAIVEVMLEASRRAERDGARFFLVMDERTGPSVQTLFELTGLRSTLPVVATRAAAVSAARAV